MIPLPQILSMVTPFIDIHTHHPIATTASEPVCLLQCYGIHPWWFDKHPETEFLEQELRLLEAMLNENRIVAIGETGIDHLHKDTLPLQIKAFEQQILLSEHFRKPLILHNVKGTQEILELHQKHHPKQTWIIHGFNGNIHDVQQLIQRDILLSVGESLFHENRKIINSIKSIPLDHLFLETDMSDHRIEDVYQRAAELLGLSVERLKDHFFITFIRRVGFGALSLEEDLSALEMRNTASPKVLLMAPVFGSRMDRGNSNESVF